MCRIFCLLIAIGFCATILPAADPGNENPSELFWASFPRELLEIYLRFHDEKLCRGVEAVFVSNESGMEVWCRVEDEGRYKKLLKMLQPLLESDRVTVYASWTSSGEDYDDEDSLPPSLWENDELRSFLDPSLMVSGTGLNSDVPVFMINPDEIFKQRLLMFSEQTLNQSRDLQRYAEDLPTLTRLALDPGLDPDLRSLAMDVCRNHSRETESQIGKLEKNLKHALPKANGDTEPNPEEPADIAGETLPELAGNIRENARSISRFVYSFIYPEQFTVQLDELRNPSLLDSLRVLRELNKDYLRRTEQSVVQ